MPSPSPAIFVPSRRFGSYRILSRIGAGAHADVFLAEARDAEDSLHIVALKVLKPGITEESFADEADLMGMLRHPNLVSRLEVGLSAGRFFIAMEYLDGGDLFRLLRGGRRLSVSVALYIAMELLEALDYFHQARTPTGRPLELIHSDVTPSNVLFTREGAVKLGDFGVASSKSSVARLGAADGMTAGKLFYLSPEHARGEALHPASDLFAVGLMLHEMLLGTHPLQPLMGAPQEEILARLGGAPLPIVEPIKSGHRRILERALAPSLERRFTDARAFSETLMEESGFDPLAAQRSLAALLAGQPARS